MQEKSKILILSTNYLPFLGGSELAIKNITDRIGDFEFDLVTGNFSKNLPKHEKLGNVNVYRVGGRFNSANILLPKIFLPIAVFFEVIKLIRNNNYIVMHAFQASQAAGGGLLASLFYPKIPFILSFQEGKELDNQNVITRFLRRLILNNLDRATAISEYLKKYIQEIRSDLPVEVIPNGVDFDSFSRVFSYGELTALAEKYDIKADEKIIITVSRLVHKNGVDILLKTAGILSKKYPELKFKVLVIGDGEEKENLKNLVNKLGIEDKVIFAGSIEPKEISKYLKMSHVFVRLSRSEGLGNAFLEAMAVGTPVVGTAVGGITDFLFDGETGLVVKTNDSENAAVRIYECLSNIQLKEHLVAKARDIVRDKYDWGKIANEFRKLYKSIAE